MVSEGDMEKAIISNPEKYIGERGLKLISEQFRIGNYIFDLLFEDRHGAKLIVEIQKGTLDREHTYKILDYYDEYRERHPDQFIDLMVIANSIPTERKRRLFSLGVEFREIPISEFIGGVQKMKSTQDSIPRSLEKTSHQETDSEVLFEMYKKQKNELINALRTYEPDMKFVDHNDPKDVKKFNENPFFTFYPARWKISQRQRTGVNFIFYVRKEYARLSVGVESPIRREYAEQFKREVVEELKRRQVNLPEFDIWPNAGQTNAKVKLLEVNFPFNDDAWKVAIAYYKKLDAFISIVSEKIDDFKKKGYVK